MLERSKAGVPAYDGIKALVVPILCAQLEVLEPESSRHLSDDH
jgi:hypothetical protein